MDWNFKSKTNITTKLALGVHLIHCKKYVIFFLSLKNYKLQMIVLINLRKCGSYLNNISMSKIGK